MRKIICNETTKQKIKELFSVKGSDFYFSMLDPYNIRFVLAVENNFNTDFYTDDFKDYMVLDLPVATDVSSISCQGNWYRFVDFYQYSKNFIEAMTKAEYIDINLDRLKFEPINESEDLASNFSFSSSDIGLGTLGIIKSADKYGEINTEIVTPFINKFGNEIKQIFKISRKDGKDMIFSESDGVIIYKISGKMYDSFHNEDALYFSYHKADKIKYFIVCDKMIMWLDENKNVIKINNIINMDDEKNIFNLGDMGEDKISFERKPLVGLFTRISNVSFSDFSYFKIKGSKTKIKLSLVDDLSVESLNIDIPVKNSKFITNTMTFSADYFKRFLSKCTAEKIEMALFRDDIIRIECDDANMFFSIREEH